MIAYTSTGPVVRCDQATCRNEARIAYLHTYSPVTPPAGWQTVYERPGMAHYCPEHATHDHRLGCAVVALLALVVIVCAVLLRWWAI